MPTLSSFYAIYTDGASLHESFPTPPGIDVFLGEMPTPILPGSHDELFGTHAAIFSRVKPKRGFLLGFQRRLGGRPEQFFLEAREAFLRAVAGLEGVALDVLRLVPFPLALAAEALPDDLLAEDLFSVGFTDMGHHGFRAETIGLSKLGHREISFQFHGHDLLEEAALMCGHLADWLLEHRREIAPGGAMSFGFDKLVFLSAEGDAGGPFRGWHPPLIQKLIPAELFPGTGVFEVRVPATAPGQPSQDLTAALRRSVEQRLLLEELDLTGDSPHSSSTAQVKGFITELKNVVALRDESQGGKDSGWRLRSTREGDSNHDGLMTLADVARRAPGFIKYFSLPHGVRLTWDAQGRLEVDRSKVELDDDFDDALPEE